MLSHFFVLQQKAEGRALFLSESTLPAEVLLLWGSPGQTLASLLPLQIQSKQNWLKRSYSSRTALVTKSPQGHPIPSLLCFPHFVAPGSCVNSDTGESPEGITLFTYYKAPSLVFGLQIREKHVLNSDPSLRWSVRQGLLPFYP